MPTNRLTLEEFSPEVRASNIQGQKLNEARHAAREDYRRRLTTPANPAAHTDRIARLARGEAVEPVTDAASEQRDAANLCRDLEEACDLNHKQSQPIRQKALAELAKTLEPEERAILKRKASAMVEAHAANLEYHELKDYLIHEGGLVGICLTDSEKILGHPKDRTSDFAMLLREFVAMGVLDKMPKSLA
jgi:uncharacterized membrane protein